MPKHLSIMLQLRMSKTKYFQKSNSAFISSLHRLLCVNGRKRTLFKIPFLLNRKHFFAKPNNNSKFLNKEHKEDENGETNSKNAENAENAENEENSKPKNEKTENEKPKNNKISEDEKPKYEKKYSKEELEKLMEKFSEYYEELKKDKDFNPNPERKIEKFIFYFSIILFLGLFTTLILFFIKKKKKHVHISFSKFVRDFVVNGKVRKVEILGKSAVFYVDEDELNNNLESGFNKRGFPFDGKFENPEKKRMEGENDVDFIAIENDWPSSEDLKEKMAYRDLAEDQRDNETERKFDAKNKRRMTMVSVEFENYEDFVRRLVDIQTELGIPKVKQIEIMQGRKNFHVDIETILAIVYLGLLFALLYAFNKMSAKGINDFKKMDLFDLKKNVYDLTRTKIRFKDVAGLKSAKIEIREFVDFLKNRDDFVKLGAKIPKGALLVGPPGTGKTLLAKAVAGETNCPFFSVSGSDFQQVYVGVGASRVRSLFKKARKQAPSIIFIDEIDSIARRRDSGAFQSNSEREATLNQLLVEMDGFNKSTGVIVLAGTNRADQLDPAITRPGRFDRKIAIDYPDIEEREEIFNVHLKPLKLKDKPEEISKKMAALTPKFSGADISNICNEAAIVAGREHKTSVDLEDFVKALDRVIGGMEKSRTPMSPIEKKHIAFHEAGHAVAGWFTKHANPLLKVTIIPRTGGVMGFAQYLPNELEIMTVSELRDTIAMALGGRISELIFFNHLSTGASNDLEKVTQLAYGYVSVFGFCPDFGKLSFPKGRSILSSTFSQKTGNSIDKSVTKLVQDVFDWTMDLLTSKKQLIEKLALALLERETLDHNEIISILGPKEYQNASYKKYLKNTQNFYEGDHSNREITEKDKSDDGNKVEDKTVIGKQEDVKS